MRVRAWTTKWAELRVESRVLTWSGGGKGAIMMSGVCALHLELLPGYRAWRTGPEFPVPFKSSTLYVLDQF